MVIRKLARVCFFAIAGLVLAGLTGEAQLGKLEVAAKGGGGGSKTTYQEPVTTVIFDNDDTGAALLMRSDDFNGSGQATYATIKEKRGAGYLVNSQIQSNGVWELALSEQSGRALWITPDQGVDSSQPTAPPAGYYAVQKVYSACLDQSGNIVPFENVVNGSGNCSLGVNFNYAGVLYKLLMRPGSLDPSQTGPGALCPSGGCPATGKAKVTCNAVGNNQCVNWTITPNAEAPLVRVSNLYSYQTAPNTAWVYIGQYYNSFSVSVTYP